MKAVNHAVMADERERNGNGVADTFYLSPSQTRDGIRLGQTHRVDDVGETEPGSTSHIDEIGTTIPQSAFRQGNSFGLLNFPVELVSVIRHFHYGEIKEFLLRFKDHKGGVYLFVEKNLVSIYAVAKVFNGVHSQHDGVEKGGKELSASALPCCIPFTDVQFGRYADEGILPAGVQLVVSRPLPSGKIDLLACVSGGHPLSSK